MTIGEGEKELDYIRITSKAGLQADVSLFVRLLLDFCWTQSDRIILVQTKSIHIFKNSLNTIVL